MMRNCDERSVVRYHPVLKLMAYPNSTLKFIRDASSSISLKHELKSHLLSAFAILHLLYRVEGFD